MLPPKTHDISRLVKLLRRSRDVSEAVEAARELTFYVEVARYPANIGEVDEAEWQEAVALARGVVGWAESVIGA